MHVHASLSPLRYLAIAVVCLALFSIISSPARADSGITELPVDLKMPTIPPAVAAADRPVAHLGVNDHPRILMPPGGMAELIHRGQTTHSVFVSRIKADADQIIAQGLDAQPSGESASRQVLRKPSQLAWAYAATGDTKYRDAAIQWAKNCCSFTHWDIDVDLAAGHGMFAIAQVYDWFYNDITPTDRAYICTRMQYHGNLLDSPFGPIKVVGGTWWTKSYLQNHGSINCDGLFAAGAVFYQEIPEAPAWLNHSEGYFDNVFRCVCEDGSSMEGYNYWAYGAEHLQMYADMAKSVTGRNFDATSGQLRNQGQFLLSGTTPWLYADDHVMPYGYPTLGTGTHGPYHTLFRSASISRDPRVQDLAFATWDANCGSLSWMKVFCLLWYDPTLSRVDYRTSATMFASPELGIVTMRNAWDSNATAMLFHCGDYQGNAATTAVQKDVSSGHGEADQTAFQIVTRGQRITAYGNGLTANQSAITFRGTGQYGENVNGLIGADCYGKVQPRLLRASTSDAVDYIGGDAGGIYKSAAGVNRYRRHIVFLKPDTFLIVDDVTMNAGTSSYPDIDWRLSTINRPVIVSPDYATVTRGSAVLDVYRCSPDDFTMSQEGPINDSGDGVESIFLSIYRLKIVSTRPITREVMVTALHCRGTSDPAMAKPTVQRDGELVHINVSLPTGQQTVTVDLTNSTGSPNGAGGQVVARQLFYNGSAFDGNDLAANAADDGAIASDKTALLPGNTSSCANCSSFSRGVNGVMIDISGLKGSPNAADFVCKLGRTGAPSTWTDIPVPTSITTRPGAGVNGSDRVTIIFPDGAIADRWLQVTVKATAITDLGRNDVFYFGSAIGDTGDSAGDTRVTPADAVNVRNHGCSLLNPAAIDNTCDFDRDRQVNATDEIIARAHGSNSGTALPPLTAP